MTTDATAFPVNGQAFRLPCAFRDTSGNLLTGWTGAAAIAYPDNGTGVTVSIAEAPSGAGVGVIDIPGAQMTASMTVIKATIGNANAVPFVAAVYPLSLGQFTGRWDGQSPQRLEQLLQDLFILLGGNGAAQTGAALSFSNPDGSTHFSCSINQSMTTGSRSKTE